MSHVATIKCEVKDLDALRTAAAKLGLEFREGQKTYRWWGHHVGDYPLPTGFTKDDLGKCDHALSVSGNDSAYEVGIVKRRDGKAGYELLWDFYGGGRGLQACVGPNGNKLVQGYQYEASRNAAIRDGWSIESTRTLDNGTVQLTLAR